MADEAKGPSVLDKAADAIGNPFKASATNPRRSHHKAGERKARAPRAKATGPKKNLTDGLALAWGGLGTVVARTGEYNEDRGENQNGPVGRCMQFQAHYAGKQLNDLIKGNDVLYRWLAPVFGQKGLIGMTNVIGAPMLVYMMGKDPMLEAMLLPALASMLKPAVAEHKRTEARAREMAEEMGTATDDEDLMEVLNLIGGGRPVAEPPSENGQGPEA